MKEIKEKQIEKISEIFRNKTNLKLLLFLDEQSCSFYKLKKDYVSCPPSLVNSLKILAKNKLIEIKREGGRKIYRLSEKGKKVVEIIKRLDFL